MKKNCGETVVCFLFMVILAALLLFIPSESVLAAKKAKKPGKVRITSVKISGNNKVSISWKKTSNATKYRIYYKKSGAKSWKKVADVSKKKTKYIHTSSSKKPLVNGKKYVYTVRAYNKAGKQWGKYNKKGISVKIPAKSTTQSVPTTKPTPAPTPSENKVKVNGVTFDMSFFPKAVSVGDNMACLSVMPKSTINPSDITYKIANGNAQQLSSPETPNLHLSYGTEYASEYYVSDWKNMIAYVQTSYESNMYLQYRVEIYNQLQTGTFPVSVYYKNTLIRTCQVTVTKADSKMVKYRQWMNNVEQKIWKNNMSAKEKLVAIDEYIYKNYTYTTDGIKCNSGAQALLFAARDLGLTARYHFVGPEYDYIKGYGDVYYHFGAAFCGGHVCTIVTIDNKEYVMETQGHEG